MSTLNILMICASKGQHLGGMEKQALWLSAQLASNFDAHVTLICDESLADSFQALYQKYQGAAAIDFETLPFTLNRRHPALIWRLRQILKRVAPDIAHAHGSKAAYLLGYAAKGLGGLLKLASVHGTKRSHRELKRMDHVLAVSKHIQNQLKQEARIDASLIENGVPCFTQRPYSKARLCEEFGFASDQPLVVALGRLAKVKNFTMLMRAFSGIRNANLLIIGDGPEKLHLSSLERENIKLAGHREDGRAILYAADLYVMCSFREGMSLSLIEALQAKVPCVASPVSGALELLPKHCLVDIDSVDTLKADIEHALGNLKSLKVSLEPYFDYAERTLNDVKMSKRVATCYESLLST